MSIVGAAVNLQRRMATVGIRIFIAFFIILLQGEAHGKYLEVKLRVDLQFKIRYSTSTTLKKKKNCSYCSLKHNTYICRNCNERSLNVPFFHYVLFKGSQREFRGRPFIPSRI